MTYTFNTQQLQILQRPWSIIFVEADIFLCTTVQGIECVPRLGLTVIDIGAL